MNEDISNDYLAGFADGEGCFYVGIVPAKTAKFGWQIITEFRVSQNPQGRQILEAFRERLGCGTIKPNHRFSLTDRTLVFVVREQQELLSKVVPFFEHHPIRSDKRWEFERFRTILLMIREKKHLEREGFIEIVNIASEMNTKNKRYSKEKILASLHENPQRLYAES
ncbi:MAG: LAGLIDADG family homing endonuclease [Candidatus Methanomethyliaceae archaeon]